MRTSPLVGLALMLGACNPNYYGVDTGDSAAVDDTATDTSTDTEDSDTQVETSTCHAADPLAIEGWSRNYTVTWEGNSGTEVHTGQGSDYDSRGNEAYVVKIDFTAGSDHLTTLDFRACNSAGGADWLESRVDGTAEMDMFGDMFEGLDFQEILALLELLGGSSGATSMPVNYRKLPSVGVPYLTDVAGLSAGATRAYDYELTTSGTTTNQFSLPNCNGPTGQMDSTCVGIDGQITGLGLTSVTVPAGTFQAYRVLDERTERWSEASAAGGMPDLSQIFPGMPGFGFGETTDQDLISELYYVPGIGLVKERTKYATAAADDWLMVRELTSFSGLTATE